MKSILSMQHCFCLFVRQDGFLTKPEVIEKYELFVGSQATDYGEVLSRHDEF